MNSVLKKMSIIQTIILLFVFTLSIFGLSYIVKEKIISDVQTNFYNKIVEVKSSFEVLNESIKVTAKSASNSLEKRFFDIEMEKDEFVMINGVKTNVLKSNGEIINSNNVLMDDFTNMSGAIATIFVKVENDFYRIATSLQKEEGTRAIGTYLTDKNPAFKNIVDKKDYIGAAKLFGKNYMTVYKPIIQDNEVIGVFFVGYNFDTLYSILQSKLSQVKFGDTGFVYTIDTKESIFFLLSFP